MACQCVGGGLAAEKPEHGGSHRKVEKRRPLDGRLKTRTPDDKEIELRLSTIPTAMGEKMVELLND